MELVECRRQMGEIEKVQIFSMQLLLRFSLLVFILSTSSIAISQDQMFDICPLKVGAEVPAVTLTNSEGQVDSLSTLIGEKPTVIVFYRGAWCGYCIQHLRELNAIQGDLDSLGYQIFGITIDQPSKLAVSLEKAEAEMKVYSDAKLEASRAFGLDWTLTDEMYDKYKSGYNLDLEEWSGEKHHSLPVPAIYIIKDNVVQFQYVNPKYSSRLSADTLLAILSSMSTDMEATE